MTLKPKRESGRAPAKGQEDRISNRLRLVHEVKRLQQSGAPITDTMRRLARTAGVSLRTAYRDLERFDQQGDLGLARKQPSNAGQPRVFVSRRFDRELDDKALLAEISAQLDTFLKSLWKSPLCTGGAKKIGKMASDKLKELSESQALVIPQAALSIPRHRVMRFSKYRIVHQRRADRKAFNDGAPRIRSDYSQLSPMELVVGDVKHLDVLVSRPEGGSGYPKLVAFEDTATGRVFVRIFLLPPGEQVRREHVSQTFIEMASDPSWGFPDCLRIDRGSEFGAFEQLRGVFAALARAGVSGVFKTRPYSPQSKSIEGWFGRFDEWGVSALPGYVGPDRLNKKVETMGRPPKPFPGIEEFTKAISALVDEYAHWPIGGSRRGQSPTQIFNGCVNAGWRPQIVDPLVLDAAFREIKTARVDRGKLKIKGEHYYHSSLNRLVHGTRVEVAHAWRRQDMPFYREVAATDWIPLEVDKPYHPQDPEGAIEASGRRAAYSRAVTELDRECPTINPVALLTSGRQSSPPPVTASRAQPDFGREIEALVKAVANDTKTDTVEKKDEERQRRNQRVSRLLALHGNLGYGSDAKERAP